MKLIDTSVITPSAGYPGLANNGTVQVGLDFMQQAALDNASALALALAADPLSATILSGCQLVSGNISEGWVYYAGEIFYAPATAVGASPGIGYFLNAGWTPSPTDTGANQTVLSDNSVVSIHNQRIIGFAWTLSTHGNLPDFGNWIPTRILTDEASIATINSEISTINGQVSTLNTEVSTINSELTSINSTLSSFDPKGTVKMFAGPVSGAFDGTGLGISNWTGWAICNGSNSTPDLAGMFIAGYDQFNLGSDYGSIGNSGGLETVLLTDAESGLPAHAHGVTDPGHVHSLSGNAGGAISDSTGVYSVEKTNAGSGDDFNTRSAVTNVTINSSSPASASTAHENRPPYYVLAYVMKIV